MAGTSRLLNRRRESEIRGGLPPKPKPKVSFLDAILQFFGIHDDDEERQLWEARQHYYLRKRLRDWGPRQPATDDEFDGQDQPDGVEMQTMQQQQRKRSTSTGRALDKKKQPDHRLRPAMPSVPSMIVSGLRTLFKKKPVHVDENPSVINARSFRPGDDSDTASDVSDDGESFYNFDKPDAAQQFVKSDGHSSTSPPIAVAEVETVTSKKPLDVKPLYEDVPDGTELSSRDEYLEAIARTRPRGLKKREPKDTSLFEDRRDIGMGVFGKWFQYSYKTAREVDPITRSKVEDVDMHRPYFTYWLIFVQVVILLTTMAVYDVAPIGFEFHKDQKQILTTSLAIETRERRIQRNIYIGPTFEDLIHLGAKYAPCMRRDKKVHDQIEAARIKERDETACCIRLDGSGCVQQTEKECNDAVFTQWEKWNNDIIDGDGFRRSSGSVCGQDPRDCLQPQSLPGPQRWPDDITKWPICLKPGNGSGHINLQYEVTGRPCCVGLRGECYMTTEEECDFLRGYYHEDYTLCSQVNCLQSICGLSDFLDPYSPDQFYRIWISLFLHVGVLHCIISIVFELVILRDMEKLSGWFRISIIFIFSGVGGNIISAFYTPYQPEVGPSGALFGLLATLVMQVFQKWNLLRQPLYDLGKLLLFIFLLFLIGFLPFVDNYAHFGGFVFGLLLSAIFLPYFFMEKTKRIWMIVGCSVVFVVLFVLFFVLFYTVDLDCPGCKYFSCIPFTDTFCEGLDTKLSPSQKEVSGL